MTTQTDTGPRIYVASLSDYNAGRLHGVWIDAAQDADDIRAEVTAMLALSPEGHAYDRDEPVANGPLCKCGREPGDTAHRNFPAEEWAIHDYDMGGISISEWESFDTVSRLALLLEEHGAPFAAFADYHGIAYADADGFDEAYNGEFDSEQAYAEEWVDSTGMLADVPEIVRYHFDYESFTRDLFMGDYYSVGSPSGVYVFRNI